MVNRRTTDAPSASPRLAAFDAAMATAARHRRAGDAGAALASLERAHVLGQRDIGRHLSVHVAMLRVAWALKDGRELRGQLLRIVLTPLGHLTRWLPRGNTGRSNVSAFAPMPVSRELDALLDEPDH